MLIRKYILAFVFSLFLVHAQNAHGADISEYDLKAAYLFNFLSFAEFPKSETPIETYQICVFNGSQLRQHFSSIDGESLKGLPVKVKFITSTAALSGCHLVFIPKSSNSKAAGIVNKTAGKPVLTIGEVKGFCEKGGMLNFFTLDNKLRFEVNLKKTRDEGINLRSKLLKRARLVE